MTTNDFTPNQIKLLQKAQKIIDNASETYVNILEQHIHSLGTSLDDEDTAGAIQICHLIHSQAGTFGWPLAGEISGWYKRILEQQKENGLNGNVSKLFMDSFNIMIKNNLKAESKAAVDLLLHIESSLKKENIR